VIFLVHVISTRPYDFPINVRNMRRNDFPHERKEREMPTILSLAAKPLFDISFPTTILCVCKGRRGRDHMIVGFTT
jgi:hypothetical protein